MAPRAHDTTRLEVLRFNDQLEQVVKRHRPIDWAIAAVQRLNLGKTSPRLTWTHFELLHSIEACCAYARGHAETPVTEQHLRNAVNVFRSNESPYELHLLQQEHDVEMFFLLQGRKQLELQEDTLNTRHAYGRYATMFDSECVNDPLSHLLEREYGLTFDSWAVYCLSCYGRAHEDGLNRVRLARYCDYLPGLFDERSLRSFLRFSALTPNEIGAEYTKQRERVTSAQMQVSLPSIFLEYPVIDFSDDRLLVPAPHLMLRHLVFGMEKAVSAVSEDTWSNEYGSRFERYVGRLLNQFPCTRRERPDCEKDTDSEKRCDYWIELDDCHLLIECKATRLRQRLLVRERLARDSSSRRIADSVCQLTSTALSLHDRVDVDTSKPCLAITIVADEVFGANRDWYWLHALEPNFRKSRDLPSDWKRGLRHRPQVMPILAFELLAALVAHGQRSCLEIMDNQVDLQRDIQNGDWARGLRVVCADVDAEPTLPFLRDAFNGLTERMDELDKLDG